MTTIKKPAPWYRVYAKAIVAAVEAGIVGAAGPVAAALLTGHSPTEAQWWTSLGLGLTAAFGIGAHVSATTNAPLD